VATNPVPLISSKLAFNLSRDFLPPVPPGKALPKLTQPQADTIIGYLSNLQVIDPSLATAFIPEEEDALAHFTLNPILVFPFLSLQWKPATGESHMIAHYQSARDGAATSTNFIRLPTDDRRLHLNAHISPSRATSKHSMFGCTGASLTLVALLYITCGVSSLARCVKRRT
jgi:hypothetical protein